MSLKQQINELEAYNFFYSAYVSEIPNNKTLDKIGFSCPFHQPKISIKTPDFIAIKLETGYALLVECKSGHLQKEDIKQAKEYSKLFGLYEIEQECRKILRDNKFKLNKFDIAFQYYDNMLVEATEKNAEELIQLENTVSIFSCKKGGLYKVYSKAELNDQETHNLLSNGIRVPQNPDPKYLLTDDANEDLIAFSIVTHFLKHITTQKNNVQFTMNELEENLYGHYEIKPKIKKRSIRLLEKADIFRLNKKHPEILHPENTLITTKKKITTKGIVLIKTMIEEGKSLSDIVQKSDKSLDPYF